jgi:hypothetical protein
MDEEFPSLSDQLADELDDIRDYADKTQELIEPTDEEKRNGWTAETLTEYIAERRAGQSLHADPNSLQSRIARRPAETNHTYNPHRWRG